MPLHFGGYLNWNQKQIRVCGGASISIPGACGGDWLTGKGGGGPKGRSKLAESRYRAQILSLHVDETKPLGVTSWSNFDIEHHSM
jgi:hypothetical protein